MKNMSTTVAEEQHLNTAMTELVSRLTAAGCFAPALVYQSMHILLVVAVYASAYAALLFEPAIGLRMLALVALAFCCVQAGFIAHEAGHGALTRRRWLAELLGQFLMTFLTALCYSHFQKIHKCHHSRCNERDADIDLHSGAFSLYPEAVCEKRSAVTRFITRYQAYLIWPLVSLQGLTLKIDSLMTIKENPRATRIDQLLVLLHFLLWIGPPTWFIGLGQALVNYLLMTWLIGPYLGSMFIINHVGTHIVEPNERRPRLIQILLTTRNVGDTRLADVLFGGINNHIEHHLFPTIPSARLHRARSIVKKYCRRRALAYHETTWTRAVAEVFVYLKAISRQACAAYATSAERETVQ